MKIEELEKKYKKIVEIINDTYLYSDSSYVIALLKEIIKEV